VDMLPEISHAPRVLTHFAVQWSNRLRSKRIWTRTWKRADQLRFFRSYEV
jgi:hypothetical protein